MNTGVLVELTHKLSSEFNKSDEQPIIIIKKLIKLSFHSNNLFEIVKRKPSYQL